MMLAVQGCSFTVQMTSKKLKPKCSRVLCLVADTGDGKVLKLVLEPGDEKSDRPLAGRTIARVEYVGKLQSNGVEFDRSVGYPFEFTVGIGKHKHVHYDCDTYICIAQICYVCVFVFVCVCVCVFILCLRSGKAIKGWDLCLPTMHVGEKCRLWVESDYAYGGKGSKPDIPPHATLVFDMTLESMQDFTEVCDIESINDHHRVLTNLALVLSDC